MSDKYKDLLKQLLTDCGEVYNGHNQLTLPKYVDTTILLELADEIAEEHNGGMASKEIFGDGSWQIKALDYFTDHPLGHKDKILVGSGDE